MKLVADFDPNLVELANLDCTIRNKLPRSFKTISSKMPFHLVDNISFQIIRILNLQNEDRIKILGMRSAEERLKAALSLMKTVCPLFCSIRDIVTLFCSVHLLGLLHMQLVLEESNILSIRCFYSAM